MSLRLTNFIKAHAYGNDFLFIDEGTVSADDAAGIATQSKWLQRGLDVDNKAERMARYLRSFRKELITLAHAAGYQHPAQFVGFDVEVSTGVNKFSTLSEVLGYQKDEVPFTDMLDYPPTP